MELYLSFKPEINLFEDDRVAYVNNETLELMIFLRSRELLDDARKCVVKAYEFKDKLKSFGFLARLITVRKDCISIAATTAPSPIYNREHSKDEVIETIKSFIKLQDDLKTLKIDSILITYFNLESKYEQSLRWSNKQPDVFKFKNIVEVESTQLINEC